MRSFSETLGGLGIVGLWVLSLFLSGCEVGHRNPYEGSVTVVTRTGGHVFTMDVFFPPNNHSENNKDSFRITKRGQADKLIEGLQSMVMDLKSARDEMAVEEPPLPKKGK
jgi:hypothetical protein